MKLKIIFLYNIMYEGLGKKNSNSAVYNILVIFLHITIKIIALQKYINRFRFEKLLKKIMNNGVDCPCKQLYLL